MINLILVSKYFPTSSPGGVFGSSTSNVFGGKAAFGQPNPTAAAIFGGGGAAAFGQQKPANSFWAGGNANTEGGFGSTGFGNYKTRLFILSKSIKSKTNF